MSDAPHPGPPARFDAVAFLSDFGRSDIFVGVCHGVIASGAPHARIIDLTHEVEPGDIAGGALLLERAAVHLPVSVALAVVDPGVGTDRRGIAVAVGRGDVLVGPDNGLLVPAANALGGVVGAWELTDPAHRRHPVSATFHGRDVFAPAAAAVAAGLHPSDLGDLVTDLVTLGGPDRARRVDGGLRCQVVLVDRFGNAQLDADDDDAASAGLVPGAWVEVAAADRSATVPVVATFGALAHGDLGVLLDSDDRVAVVANGGPAAVMLDLARGTVVHLTPTEGPRDEQEGADHRHRR